jgi:hypothetical protein
VQTSLSLFACEEELLDSERGQNALLVRDVPESAALEKAIFRHLSLQPAHERAQGKLYVKVTDIAPVNWPPDSKQLQAALFLSVPFLGGERTKLDQAVARIRRGFNRNEILPGWKIELSAEKAYSHRDEDVGAVLLTVPVVLTLEPIA